jgi:hypothetical protein
MILHELQGKETARHKGGRGGKKELTGGESSDELDMSWLPLSRFESRAVCGCVLQCMGEGEANGGGDGMAVGPMGVELDRG